MRHILVAKHSLYTLGGMTSRDVQRSSALSGTSQLSELYVEFCTPPPRQSKESNFWGNFWFGGSD